MQTAANTYYSLYRRFYTSRINFWQPKIYAAVTTLAQSVIDGKPLPDFSPLATVLKSMYIDAGRILGARAYQDVMKQRKREQKQLLPIGYNEQLIAIITQYYQTSLFNDAVLPISETIRDIVLARMILAQQQGDSISDVIRDLKHQLARRAEVIARTETVKAANYGAKQGALLTGYNMNKIWISAQDNRTRREPRDMADHLRMNGIEIGMNEMFSVPSKNGIVLMDRPGDSGAPASTIVNCRCALGFRVL